ncbi:MAG: hypothetical protein QXI91_02800 [Candidatus Bathyarchaeia archaeon]
MNKKKPTSLVFISLLLLSTLILTYTPTAESVSFTGTSQNFYGTLTPETVSGAYPYPQVKFLFNITSNVTSPTFINKTAITWPQGWAYVSGDNGTDWNVTDVNTGSRTVTFQNATVAGALYMGNWTLLNVTMIVQKSGSATWQIECYNGTDVEGWTSVGTASVNVYVTPWFDATITPTIVRRGQSIEFQITVKNNASTPQIYQVNVTYPSTHGWTFEGVTAPAGWMIESHTNYKISFKATGGYEIAKGYSAVFKVKMTTGGNAGSTNDYTWTVDVKNTADATDTMDLIVTSDNTPPTVSVTAPAVSHYSVGHGNYMWLNITVHDDLNQVPTVVLNDTRFTLSADPSVSGTYDFKFYYRNNTAISDGPLAIQINVTDHIGNSAIEYPKIVSTTVDNVPPFIWITVTPATPVGSTFWIGKDLDKVDINVTVADYQLESIGPLTGIYINGTLQSGWAFTDTGNKYNGYTVWACIETNYALTLEKNYWIIYVNVTDTAHPKNHTSEMTVYIQRDHIPPYEIGFTSAKPICGGLIIYGLYARDTVGIQDYRIYVNGTNIANVTYTHLIATTWQETAKYGAFLNITVLNMTSYAGKYVNVTASARDYGYNEGNKTIVYTGLIPEGLWYPIVLQKDWNLISLPLVPANSSITNVLSLLLKAETLVSVWHYDAETSSWHSYAPGAPQDLTTMVDGKGYFIKVTAYNVLIIQGTEQPPPPSIPRVYHVVPGWNLIGYKRLDVVNASTYLSGVDWVRLYMFNATTQTYQYVLPSGNMAIGLGYWVAARTEGWIYP